MMRLALLLSGLSLATATFGVKDLKVTRSGLNARALETLRAEVEGGAAFVKATVDVAKLFGVEEGHAVPANVAHGSVEEHQDHFSDAGSVEWTNLLYLGLGNKEDKFTLRDTRTGEEHSIALDEPKFIKYKNKYFAHRVDAHASSRRVMLGPASIRDGVLAAVGLIKTPIIVLPDELVCDGYNCSLAVGQSLRYPFGFETGFAGTCCTVGDDTTCDAFDGSYCETEGCSDCEDCEEPLERRLLFSGIEVPPVEKGVCICPSGFVWCPSTCENGPACVDSEVGCGLCGISIGDGKK